MASACDYVGTSIRRRTESYSHHVKPPQLKRPVHRYPVPGFQRVALESMRYLDGRMDAPKVHFMLRFGLPQLRIAKAFVRY